MHVFELAFQLSWIQGEVAQIVAQWVIFFDPLVTTNTFPGTQPSIKTLVLRAEVVLTCYLGTMQLSQRGAETGGIWAGKRDEL